MASSQIISLSVQKRTQGTRSNTYNPVITVGFDVDDIVVPIRATSGPGAVSYFVARTNKNMDRDSLGGSHISYEVTNTLANISAQTTKFFLATVYTRRGTSMGGEQMIFNASRISEGLYEDPITGRTRFFYKEDNDVLLVEYIVEETVSQIVAQTNPSGVTCEELKALSCWPNLHENFAIVDAVYGNDSTAEVGSRDLKFRTLLAAQTALVAAGGTAIALVNPGIYSATNLGADGVDWYFFIGAKVVNSGTTGIFSDNGKGSISFTVRGNGSFASVNALGTGFVYISELNSNIDIEFDSVNTLSSQSIYYSTSSGKLRVKGNIHTETYQYLSYSEGNGAGLGTYIYDVKTVSALPATQGGTFSINNATNGNFRFTADTYLSTGWSVWGPFLLWQCTAWVSLDIDVKKLTHNLPGLSGLFDSAISFIGGGKVKFRGDIISNAGRIVHFSHLAGTGGWPVNDVGVVDFEGMAVQTGSTSVLPMFQVNQSDKYLWLKNSYVESRSSLDGTIAVGHHGSGGGNIQVIDTEIRQHKNDAGANVISLGNTIDEIILDGVSLEVVSPIGGEYGIYSGAANNIKIYTRNAGGNVNAHANITNVITGTNYIYDTGIINLPEHF